MQSKVPLFMVLVTLFSFQSMSAEAGSVTLAWDANTEPDVTGYIVHYGPQSGSYAGQVDVGNQVQFVVPGLTSGQQYFFAVQAYNSSGLKSALSAEVSGIVPADPAGTPTPTGDDPTVTEFPETTPPPLPQPSPTSSGAERNYLSEGATGTFFDLDVSLANTGTATAAATVRFMKEDGSTVQQTYDLPAQSQRVIHVDTVAGLESGGVATSVDAPPSVVAERTMFWDQNAYGGHSSASVRTPSTTWYFAEGAQGYFDTFLLLANPGASPASVTLYFLREKGGVVTKSVTVAPTSRLTLFAGDIKPLVNRSFSTVVNSSVPIIAERAMYFGNTPLWSGGHESAGVAAPSKTWFHAEGATGPFFDTYILIGNPGSTRADVQLTFLLESGASIVKRYNVAAYQRLTVDVEDADRRLANAAVSVAVDSSVPVVSERTMYWPGAATTWTEGHNSFGVPKTSTKWGLAEGRVGGSLGFETFILLANPGATTANVRLTFLRSSGTPIVKTVSVGQSSRHNVYVNSLVPELEGQTFGTVIESTNGVPLAVERAMYWNALGQAWAGGTNVVAIPLQ